MAKKLSKNTTYNIATNQLQELRERGDLETRNNDTEDFLDVSVWSIKKMIEEAYEEGLKEVQKEEGRIIEFNKEIKKQIMTIRETGKTNMFDVSMVQNLANDLNYYDLVIFIEENKLQYLNFIMTGENQ
ncbi:hypothetical protein RyT2_12010 [Pseudolactococcus yaeyamensis]